MRLPRARALAPSRPARPRPATGGAGGGGGGGGGASAPAHGAGTAAPGGAAAAAAAPGGGSARVSARAERLAARASKPLRDRYLTPILSVIAGHTPGRSILEDYPLPRGVEDAVRRVRAAADALAQPSFSLARVLSPAHGPLLLFKPRPCVLLPELDDATGVLLRFRPPMACYRLAEGGADPGDAARVVAELLRRVRTAETSRSRAESDAAARALRGARRRRAPTRALLAALARADSHRGRDADGGGGGGTKRGLAHLAAAGELRPALEPHCALPLRRHAIRAAAARRRARATAPSRVSRPRPARPRPWARP